jgi:hypothetical protein
VTFRDEVIEEAETYNFSAVDVMFICEEIRHTVIVDNDTIRCGKHLGVPDSKVGIFRKSMANHFEVMYQKNKAELSKALYAPKQIHIVSLQSVHRILDKENSPPRQREES